MTKKAGVSGWLKRAAEDAELHRDLLLGSRGVTGVFNSMGPVLRIQFVLFPC